MQLDSFSIPKVTPLKVIKVPGGDVYRGIKISDSDFFGFGEAYFSTIEHNQIKAWKRHRKMIMNLIVICGEVKFVLYDDRFVGSSVEKISEYVLSPKTNYGRLMVPSGVWMAFKGIGDGSNIVLNISNIEHDPDEIDRLELDSIKYCWES